MNSYRYTTVQQFVDHVGRADLIGETGISTQLVTRALADGVFPDRWVWRFRDFCEHRGFETPENLFRGHPNAPKQKASAQ